MQRADQELAGGTELVFSSLFIPPAQDVAAVLEHDGESQIGGYPKLNTTMLSLLIAKLDHNVSMLHVPLNASRATCNRQR